MYKSKIIIKGTLTTKTGVAIGGYKDDIGITSKDNPIVIDPLTQEPYIPGSSIKGRMRSLFEQSGNAGNDREKSGVCKCGHCLVCKLFGSRNSGKGCVQFFDATLGEIGRKNFDNIIETKPETAIMRDSGRAANGSLRETERIAAGVDFNYEIVISVDEKENGKELLKYVESGLKMLEIMGIGKKTSAGYGKVDFHIGEDTYSAIESKFMEV